MALAADVFVKGHRLIRLVVEVRFRLMKQSS
jgi:hypothetical protein